MKKATAILGAFGVGTGMMYFLDPDRGRRRRRLVRDKSLSAVKHIDDAIAKTSCDLSNRARGVVAEARSVVSGQRVPDDILVARVESKIGRVVTHPGAIDVRAKDGRVTLRGPVLASEVNNLIGGVRSVRGVTDVEDQLTVHKQAGDISALQGGGRGRERRFELLQENWSPTARLTMSLAGGALAVHGARHRNAFCSALGFVGLGMFVRGITNMKIKRLIGATGRRAIDIQKTISIRAPLERVFEFWSHYENLPRFMSHVREVTDQGNGRSHWVATGPAGLSVEWDSETTRYIPNREVAWKSVPGSLVQNAGIIRFEPNSDGTTRVSIRLTYNPPAGAIGHAFAKLFGSDPKSALDDDLARFKSLIEFGKTTAHGETVTREEVIQGTAPHLSAESGVGL